MSNAMNTDLKDEPTRHYYLQLTRFVHWFKDTLSTLYTLYTTKRNQLQPPYSAKQNTTSMRSDT